MSYVGDMRRELELLVKHHRDVPLPPEEVPDFRTFQCADPAKEMIAVDGSYSFLLNLSSWWLALISVGLLRYAFDGHAFRRKDWRLVQRMVGVSTFEEFVATQDELHRSLFEFTKERREEQPRDMVNEYRRLIEGQTAINFADDLENCIVAAVQWGSDSATPLATAAPAPAASAIAKPRAFSKAPRPQPAHSTLKPPAKQDDLAEPYVDQANGFSIRFPSGWIREKFDPVGTWVVDATDGKNAIISIRFSPVPPDTKLGQLHPETLALYIRSQPRTTLESQGRAVLSGRECLWFRYTSPLELINASQVMTMLHYFQPLDDGRMLELRFASTPEQFNHLGPLMRKSIASFKLLP